MFGTFPAAVHAADCAEKGSAHGDDERDDDTDGGDGIRNYVPSVAGTEPARLVASGTPGQEPEEVIVVAHGGNYTKSDVSGQLGHWHSRGTFRGRILGKEVLSNRDLVDYATVQPD